MSYYRILHEPERRLDPPEDPRYEAKVEAQERVDYLTDLTNHATELKTAFEEWEKYRWRIPAGMFNSHIVPDLLSIKTIESHLAAALDAAQGELNRIEEGDDECY